MFLLGEQEFSGGVLGTAHALNRTAHDRVDVQTWGAAFLPGEVPDEDVPLRFVGATDALERVQWWPEGVRHPDGSVRFARLAARVQCDARTEKELTLEVGRGTARPFAIHPDVTTGLATMRLQLEIEGERFGFLPHLMERVEGGLGNDVLAAWRIQSPMKHMPEGFWTDLHLEIGSGMRHSKFVLRYGNGYVSNIAGSRATHHRLTQPVRLHVFGPQVAVFGESGRVVESLREGSSTILTLLDPTAARTYDRVPYGQAPAWEGVLMFGAEDSTHRAERESPNGLGVMMTNWGDGDRYPGPARIPPMPPWITSRQDALPYLVAQVDRDWASIANSREPYHPSVVGLNNSPGDTGNQSGFSVGNWRGEYFRIAWPGVLPLVRRATIPYSFKPQWFLEPDLTQFRDANHPGVLWWYCAIHPETQVPHTLGLAQRSPSNPRCLGVSGERDAINGRVIANAGGGIHYGPDRAHWDDGAPIFDALVTQQRLPRLLVRNLTEMYSGTHTTTRGIGGAIPQTDSPRAIGRANRMGRVFSLLTGDSHARGILRDRMMLVREYSDVTGRGARGWHSGVWGHPDDRGFINYVRKWEDTRLLPAQPPLIPTWFLFQEGLFVPGMLAMAQEFDDQASYDIAWRVARSLINFGYADLRTTEQNIVTRPWSRAPERGDVIEDLRTGARGTCWCPEAIWSEGALVAWRLYLHECTGQFLPTSDQAPNVRNTDTGETVVHHIRNWGWWTYKCLALVTPNSPGEASPPTDEEMKEIVQDVRNNNAWRPRWIEMAFSTGFDQWQIGAVCWGRQEALRRGDAATAANALPLMRDYVAKHLVPSATSSAWPDGWDWAYLVEDDPWQGVTLPGGE